MPAFKFVQKEVTTHEVIVRADSREEAEEYVMALCDDEFARSDTDWDDDLNVEEVDESEADVDLDEEFG